VGDVHVPGYKAVRSLLEKGNPESQLNSWAKFQVYEVEQGISLKLYPAIAAAMFACSGGN
jgi:hypothetical protein